MNYIVSGTAERLRDSQGCRHLPCLQPWSQASSCKAFSSSPCPLSKKHPPEGTGPPQKPPAALLSGTPGEPRDDAPEGEMNLESREHTSWEAGENRNARCPDGGVAPRGRESPLPPAVNNHYPGCLQRPLPVGRRDCRHSLGSRACGNPAETLPVSPGLGSAAPGDLHWQRGGGEARPPLARTLPASCQRRQTFASVNFLSPV